MEEIGIGESSRGPIFGYEVLRGNAEGGRCQQPRLISSAILQEDAAKFLHVNNYFK